MADQPHGDSDDEDEVKERQHFACILRAIDNYEPWALAKVAKLETDYRRLSKQHHMMLDLDAKIDGMRQCIRANTQLLQRIIAPHRDHIGAPEEAQLDRWAAHKLPLPPMLISRADGTGTSSSRSGRARTYVPESDMDKLQSTLKQFVREWGAGGHLERDAAHTPLLKALGAALPRGAEDGARVLVPGAGLGRLAWEVARLGYRAQASEFSYFMLIAANYVLNGLQQDVANGRKEQFHVHPWVLQTCNVKKRSDQLRGEPVPDVPPWSLPPTAQLSMCAGDFLAVYGEQSSCWECVLTCFFIDTAHNLTEYIGLIRNLLVPGGAWVNLGPLLWHFSDIANDYSVDLTWDEVRPLILDAGFVIEHEEWHTCPYVRNTASMYRMEYECVCFTARWPGFGRGPKDGGRNDIAAGQLPQPELR